MRPLAASNLDGSTPLPTPVGAPPRAFIGRRERVDVMAIPATTRGMTRRFPPDYSIEIGGPATRPSPGHGNHFPRGEGPLWIRAMAKNGWRGWALLAVLATGA